MTENSGVLVLPATKLRFDGQCLTRHTDRGETTLRIPVESIKSVRYGWSLSWFGIVMILISAVMVWIGYGVSTSVVLTVFVYMTATLICGLGLLGIVQDKIVVETQRGKIVAACGDARDLVFGFALSMQEVLENGVR